ncbi:hypothetical protein PV396_42620 [Streptomyces sp. ME02-8801-2C]|uniref:hypothetical protein n=1 Tax=Streptomyces sp. ME02-8801-2C TaxID=3028680 RepID=UPI0029B53B56|nr:hypothetical protein [Streptomyces sp. ME02-8801-2C]MDX3458557.1 hypothetical protein [Streptomyces sp. ME02-8801-2C]
MDDEPKRYRVEFATGTAASVAKRRSYRDHERNDIEPDLPSWPPGPAFAARGFFGRLGQYVLGVVTGILMLPLYIIADALGSPSSPAKRGKLEERENEVDDFPVIWAGMGETARTLPWQLDPSRRPWPMETEIELAGSDELVRITAYTDNARGSRLLSWGGGERVPGSEVVLWTLPRKEIIGAELKPFSMEETDFTIFFQDGSWARLTSHGAREIVALLGSQAPADSSP